MCLYISRTTLTYFRSFLFSSKLCFIQFLFLLVICFNIIWIEYLEIMINLKSTLKLRQELARDDCFYNKIYFFPYLIFLPLDDRHDSCLHFLPLQDPTENWSKNEFTLVDLIAGNIIFNAFWCVEWKIECYGNGVLCEFRTYWLGTWINLDCTVMLLGICKAC